MERPKLNNGFPPKVTAWGGKPAPTNAEVFSGQPTLSGQLSSAKTAVSDSLRGAGELWEKDKAEIGGDLATAGRAIAGGLRSAMPATAANFDRNKEVRANANGFAENVGATLGNGARLAGGVILDAGMAMGKQGERSFNGIVDGAQATGLFGDLKGKLGLSQAQAAEPAPVAPVMTASTKVMANDPAVPNDVAKFNAGLRRKGVNDAAMTVDENGQRSLGNVVDGLRMKGDESINPGGFDRISGAEMRAINAGYERDNMVRDMLAPRDTGMPSIRDTTARQEAALARGQRGFAAQLAQDESAERRTAETNATSAENQRLQTAASIMNNQNTTEATMATARASQTANQQNAQRLRDDKDRELTRKEEKDMFDQRSKREKDITDRLSTIMTTKDDKGNAVPDAARVGDAYRKITEEIGARIQEAQASGNPEAKALAEELSKKGLAALDDEDIETLLSQAAIRDRMMQQNGRFTPGGANAVESRLGGYTLQGVDPEMIGSDKLTLANGGMIREADLRYTEPSNTLWPDMGKVPTDLFQRGLRANRNQ